MKRLLIGVCFGVVMSFALAPAALAQGPGLGEAGGVGGFCRANTPDNFPPGNPIPFPISLDTCTACVGTNLNDEPGMVDPICSCKVQADIFASLGVPFPFKNLGQCVKSLMAIP